MVLVLSWYFLISRHIRSVNKINGLTRRIWKTFQILSIWKRDGFQNIGIFSYVSYYSILVPFWMVLSIIEVYLTLLIRVVEPGAVLKTILLFLTTNFPPNTLIFFVCACFFVFCSLFLFCSLGFFLFTLIHFFVLFLSILSSSFFAAP